MKKSISKIQVPDVWVSKSDWDSHKGLLYLSLEKTEGTVVELGSGFGSSPFLQDYCRDKNRDFITYETNKDWADKTGSVYTDNYFKELGSVGLIFIDCSPGEIRKDLVEFYRNVADVILLHDTETGARSIYGITEVLKSFKYRLDFCPDGSPATTALSDTINVSEWI